MPQYRFSGAQSCFCHSGIICKIDIHSCLYWTIIMLLVEPFLFLESPCIEASSNDGDHCAAEVHASLIKHGSCTSSRAASQWLVQNSYRSGPTLKPCTMLSYTASVFSRCDQGDARLMHRGFYSGPRTIRILHEPLRCCAVACAWPMLYQCRM